MSTAVEPESDHAASAAALIDTLLACGITHAVWLVDSETSSMYEALMDAEAAGRLRTVPVCREGETIAIATGLMIGGVKPVVIIQNTGLFESGDSLRGQALDLRMPMLMMIGYRGWKPEGQQVTDSAARLLEPVLDAYGVPHWTMGQENFADVIPSALAEAERRSGPVAVLVPAEWAE